MKTVHEASQISGVSVRTLHHYDAIGLLRPTAATEAGYRLYDDTALARLQSILLFRELAFPLKEIKRIMDDPQFDQATALEQQIRLLELQQEHLSRLIDLARETMKTGVTNMDFTAFDTRLFRICVSLSSSPMTLSGISGATFTMNLRPFLIVSIINIFSILFINS